MDETKLNWEDLRLFLAVARAGGLSAAVSDTGKSAPTLGRRMLAVEAAVGGELFRRLPRGYELTEQGEDLLARIADLETQIQSLGRFGRGPAVIKISAGSWMTYVLCRHIHAIQDGLGATRLQFISAEHVLDIAHREAVIGIRNRRPEQRGLACRKIGHVRFAGYATGKSVRPWVRVAVKTPSAAWLAAQPDSGDAVEVTSPRNALDLACAGAVRAVLPTFVGDAQEGLLRVTPTIPELSHDQWLVTHDEERFQPNVRRVIDRIYEIARSLHRGA
ncbi:LysR family transcriptional regulator [Pelagibius marinus]|uniref:LysR family transcriptional regulator n=1 Tax=Pelagibius marinus TaxID=2762760 RepID=UPI001872817B|nr:LysR family transcriptional regulator [Pelagibius marinus]